MGRKLIYFQSCTAACTLLAGVTVLAEKSMMRQPDDRDGAGLRESSRHEETTHLAGGLRLADVGCARAVTTRSRQGPDVCASHACT